MTFLDTLLHMIVLAETGRSLRLPTRIRSVYIDPVLHPEHVCQYQDNVEGNVFCLWAFTSSFECCVYECLTFLEVRWTLEALFLSKLFYSSLCNGLI